MESLVYLVHRIPYPPNKGDKIRSYHWLRFLSERYRVHLGTFVDDDDDWRHVETLEKLCADVLAVPLDPKIARLKSMVALFRGEALTLPYYWNRELKAWVDRKLEDEKIARALVFSSPMAQYVSSPSSGPHLRKVIDFVDVDSEKWRQYASRRSWPMSWIFRREGARLLEFESRTASSAAASVFVTDEEASLFKRRAPGVTAPVRSVINGVDTEYFSPERAYPNPPERGGPVVVFTGMMDYWANVDAVEWFAKEMLPSVRRRHDAVCFEIVGARPSRAVVQLRDLPGVEVTGSVEDVRPYLARAAVSVAPMRVARGIQNKVLEAYAMARPVIATPDAMEGLDITDALRESVSDDPATLVRHIVRLLELPSETRAAIGSQGREWVRDRHDWSQTLKPVEELIA